MRRITLIALVIGISGLAAGALIKLRDPAKNVVHFAAAKAHGGYTSEQRLAQYGSEVRERLAPAFAAAGVAYPPREIAYVAFKDKRLLEVHARNASGEPWRFVKRYQVLAASGVAGPKLREGDKQVPEGIYRADFLNPNSRFHLSIRLNYPNEFDRRKAKLDSRTQLGGDIMIHGSAVSIGCLAMGDDAAEDLFIMAALATKERTRIVVSPTDFRSSAAPMRNAGPAWTGELYEQLRSELRHYRTPS
jgi:hypothetical protein